MLGHSPFAARKIVNAAAIAAIVVLVMWWLTAHGYDEQHNAAERSVPEWIEFWLNRYQTFIGVLAATFVGWLAYSATRETIISNEKIAERQFTEQQNDLSAAWGDAFGLVRRNIETARIEIASLRRAWEEGKDWESWRELYRNRLAPLDFGDRANEIDILLPHVAPSKKVVGHRAAVVFRHVDQVLCDLRNKILDRAAPLDDAGMAEIFRRLEYVDNQLMVYWIVNSSVAAS